MKVVILDMHPERIVGGAEETLRALGEYLSAEDRVTWFGASYDFYRLIHVFYRILGSSASKLHEVDQRNFKFSVRRFSIATLVPFSKNFRRARQLFIDADVIYAKNEIVEMSALAFVGGKDAVTKTVIGVHTPYRNDFPGNRLLTRVRNSLYQSRFYQRCIKKAAAIHALSEDINMDFTYLTRGDQKSIEMLKAKTQIIPLGVVAQIENNPPPIKPSFAAVGRLTYQKGFDRFIALLKERPDLNLTIAGSGGKSDELRAQLKGATFLGALRRNEVEALYRESVAVFIPSRWETQCLVLLEALAAGRPAIVQNLQLFKGMIPEAYHWLMVDFEYPSTVTKAIDRILAMLNDGVSYRLMSDELHFWATTRFNKETQLQHISNVIRQAAVKE